MKLKAVALYRDGSKLAQVLNTQNSAKKEEEAVAPQILIEKEIVYKSERRRLPDERRSLTHKFSIGGHEGYITVGQYDDGTPGEIFINMAKQGSVISGMMDAFATSISIALQYNVPLEVLVSKFSHMRFEPSGMTNNPNIRLAKSIVDYIFRWMGMKFLDRDTVSQLGIHFEKTADADINSSVAATPIQVVIDGVQEKKAEATASVATPPVAVGQTVKLAVGAVENAVGGGSQVRKFKFDNQGDAPSCGTCGGMTVRNGSCYLCRDCGATSGCS
jgi:ribonucleoside-diphosphate reductase alpha chain